MGPPNGSPQPRAIERPSEMPHRERAQRAFPCERADDRRSQIERDSFGDIAVPAWAYWGARTERSRENFPIGGDLMPIESYMRWRASSSRPPGQRQNGLLEPKIADAIVVAAREVIDGKLDEHFPLVVWQTGSGTQTNMNVNEVIANRANEMLGARARLEIAGASQRSRQSRPVVERQFSDRHAHRRRAHDFRSADSRRRAAACCAQRQGGEIRQYHQDWPHRICRTRRR